MNTSCTCAITGTSVDASECADIILSVGQDMAAKCATCPRPPSASSADSPPAALSAWQRIKLATGITTLAKLAGQLGSPVDITHKQLSRLDAGMLPRSDNTFIPKLLRLTSLRLCDFIPGAPDTWDPDPGDHAQALSSAFGPLAEAVQTERAEPIVDTTGTPVQVPAGDIAADLANPSTILHMPGQAPPVLMGADPDKELITEGEAAQILASARAQDAPVEPGGEADGWEEYTGRAPAKPSSPHLCIDRNGKLGLTIAAVREFGISHSSFVDLLWNAQRRQIGIRIVAVQGRASLRISGNPHSHRHQINGAGFWQQFGLRPVSGQYPLQRLPSGLLVATIELESEEAKAS